MSYYTVNQIRSLKDDGKLTWKQIGVLDSHHIRYDTIKSAQQIIIDSLSRGASFEDINNILMSNENVNALRNYDIMFNTAPETVTVVEGNRSSGRSSGRSSSRSRSSSSSRSNRSNRSNRSRRNSRNSRNSRSN